MYLEIPDKDLKIQNPSEEDIRRELGGLRYAVHKDNCADLCLDDGRFVQAILAPGGGMNIRFKDSCGDVFQSREARGAEQAAGILLSFLERGDFAYAEGEYCKIEIPRAAPRDGLELLAAGVFGLSLLAACALSLLYLSAALKLPRWSCDVDLVILAAAALWLWNYFSVTLSSNLSKELRSFFLKTGASGAGIWLGLSLLGGGLIYCVLGFMGYPAVVRKIGFAGIMFAAVLYIAGHLSRTYKWANKMVRDIEHAEAVKKTARNEVRN